VGRREREAAEKMAFIVHGASPFGGTLTEGNVGPEIHQPNPEMALVCVGCDNFRAGTYDELKEHYKSEWHRHNLKRKLALLAPIGLQEFEQRVAAFAGDTGNDRSKKKEHLGSKARAKAEKRAQKHQSGAQQAAAAEPAEAGAREPRGGSRLGGGMGEVGEDEQMDVNDMSEEEFMEWKLKNSIKLAPGDSLFDRHSCGDDMATNLEYMASTYGFFVPFLEHVEDLPALMDYLRQKVSVGNVCLWCNKGFHSMEGVMKHMVDKSHCKVGIEGNEDEFQDFYSISLGGEDEEWETDSEEEVDEEMPDIDVRNAKGKGANAARLSQKHSKKINELEVSGGGTVKVLGHRAFNKYYRQSLRPLREDGGESTRKIVALIGDAYVARGAVTRFQGSSRRAKQNRQGEKFDNGFEMLNSMRVAIARNKFHRVRRNDYHA